MDRANQLGDYLKARRAQLAPERLRLPSAGVRRVPGLRREEVASLAGVSVDYYTRLEQGRERHPSASVLNALCRVFELGPDAQRYLFTLASPGPTTVARQRGISQNLLELVEEWTNHPTVLMDECHSVVVANQLGAALYAGHRHSDNMLRLLFLDPDGRTFFRDWNKVASSSVAALRAAASHTPDNGALMALIGELTVRSEEFCKRWAKAEVREKTSDVLLLRHPVVGDLDLVYESLRPNARPDLLLKIYRAPTPEMSDKLAVLGSVVAAQPRRSVPVSEAPLDRQ
jgi:transcriptional regulator with XRE-family HTH domain